MRFTRTPYFQSLGIPAGIGVLVTLVASLTLTPAVIVMGDHIGLFDPKRAMRTRGWRRIGTAIVRWPGPILVGAIAIALIGLPCRLLDQLRRPPLPAGLGAGQDPGYAAPPNGISPRPGSTRKC